MIDFMIHIIVLLLFYTSKTKASVCSKDLQGLDISKYSVDKLDYIKIFFETLNTTVQNTSQYIIDNGPLTIPLECKSGYIFENSEYTSFVSVNHIDEYGNCQVNLPPKCVPWSKIKIPCFKQIIEFEEHFKIRQSQFNKTFNFLFSQSKGQNTSFLMLNTSFQVPFTCLYNFERPETHHFNELYINITQIYPNNTCKIQKHLYQCVRTINRPNIHCFKDLLLYNYNNNMEFIRPFFLFPEYNLIQPFTHLKLTILNEPIYLSVKCKEGYTFDSGNSNSEGTVYIESVEDDAICLISSHFKCVLKRKIFAHQFEAYNESNKRITNFKKTVKKLILSVRNTHKFETEKCIYQNITFGYFINTATSNDPVLMHFNGPAGFLIDIDGLSFINTTSKIGYYSHYNVFVVNYAFIPNEGTVEEAINRAKIGYNWLLNKKNYKSENIVVSGDSAGGGLAALFVNKILEEGSLDPPKAVIMTSAWLDYTLNEASFSLDGDSYLAEFLDTNLASPLNNFESLVNAKEASPLHMEIYKIFPQTRITIGNNDQFKSENIKFAQRIQKIGTKVSLNVLNDFGHCGILSNENLNLSQKASDAEIIDRINWLLKIYPERQRIWNYVF